MTNKHYDILLDNLKIGTTELEKADPPMGIVFGQINFTDLKLGYDFFKNYCLKNNVEFTDYPEDRFITTMNIPNLKVTDQNANEITGEGFNVA